MRHDKLDEEALKVILTQPKNALIKQYVKLLSMDGVELEFTDDAIEAIAAKAIEQKTGARGLRSIVEATMRDTMFNVPSHKDVYKCIVDAECINDNKQPTLLYKTKEVKTVDDDSITKTPRKKDTDISAS